MMEKVLSGGDLRSLGKSNSLVTAVKDQNDFDKLFRYLFHTDRLVVMRAADVIEKVTMQHPFYLSKHKKKIFELSEENLHKEVKWHLALLLSRLNLRTKDLLKAWNTLVKWVFDKTNSRIVRVNALQGLYEIVKCNPKMKKELELMMEKVELENIPSINARVRKIRRILNDKNKLRDKA